MRDLLLGVTQTRLVQNEFKSNGPLQAPVSAFVCELAQLFLALLVSPVFSGQEVCRKAFARFMGIGCGRLQRTRHSFRGMDERTLGGQGDCKLCNCMSFIRGGQHVKITCLIIVSLVGAGTRPALATASIQSFLRKMYYSMSETMPTKLPGI